MKFHLYCIEVTDATISFLLSWFIIYSKFSGFYSFQTGFAPGNLAQVEVQKLAKRMDMVWGKAISQKNAASEEEIFHPNRGSVFANEKNVENEKLITWTMKGTQHGRWTLWNLKEFYTFQEFFWWGVFSRKSVRGSDFFHSHFSPRLTRRIGIVSFLIWRTLVWSPPCCCRWLDPSLWSSQKSWRWRHPQDPEKELKIT